MAAELAGAEVGSSRLVEEAASLPTSSSIPRNPLYRGRRAHRFARNAFPPHAHKIKDVPPHIPALDEVRPEVSLAWKLGKARPLAEKAASGQTEKLKKKPEERLQGRNGRGYRVVTIPAIARQLRTNFLAQPIRGPAHPRKRRSRMFPSLASRSERPTSTANQRWKSGGCGQPTPHRLLRYGTRAS